ncbi:hypothetical protein GCM10010411_95890 [Actinomadura fulvescens]|uniref:Uncharacterized protein n=1 Tax=Actinomadura fulvescens TaxID=46160 RepID=A0ABP6DBK9_9ACTN
MLASTVQFSKNNRAHQNPLQTTSVGGIWSRDPRSSDTHVPVSSGPNSVSTSPATPPRRSHSTPRGGGTCRTAP